MSPQPEIGCFANVSLIFGNTCLGYLEDVALTVAGRFGSHCANGLDVGNTAERIARYVPGNVLIVNETVSESDEAEASLSWTAEAIERISRIPPFMRPMVKRAIESYARARGVAEVTPDVVSAAKTSHGVPLPGHEPGEEAEGET